MEFKIDILESDLADRAILIGLKAKIADELYKLSMFSKNNLQDAVIRLKSSVENMENQWIYWQRERVLNLLSVQLNYDRDKLGDRRWPGCDD